MAEETYTELKEQGADVAQLQEIHRKINETTAKAAVQIGVYFKEARACFPEQTNQHSEKGSGWIAWLELVGFKRQRVYELITVASTFGHLLEGDRNSGHPAFPPKSVLIELSKGKYTPAQRDGLLQAKGADLTLMDCQVLNRMDGLSLASASEVAGVVTELQTGYLPQSSSKQLEAAESTFKAAWAHASNMKRTANTYEDARRFAPAPLIKEVEDHMVSGIATWIDALPEEVLYQLKDRIESRLDSDSTSLITISHQS